MVSFTLGEVDDYFLNLLKKKKNLFLCSIFCSLVMDFVEFRKHH